MSTAALVNARAGNGGGGSTVQTTQLHQQQQQTFNTTRTSIGLSSNNSNIKKNEESILTSECGKSETSSRPPSSQSREEKKGPLEGEGKTAAVAAASKEKTGDDDKMYPDDLRNILIEVAKSGASSTLGWTEQMEYSAVAQQLPRHSPAVGPPRKKQRNGLYHSISRTGFKRPLSSHQSPGHSSRTSVSEMEDMSQYDSEGTVSSEFSMDRARAQHLLNGVLNGLNQKQSANTNKPVEGPKAPQTTYNSLRQVFRIATGSVLDHFFQNRGGYKLSPAERRRNSTVVSSNKTEGDKAMSESTENGGTQTAEEVFKKRKQRLLNLLGDSDETTKNSGTVATPQYISGPPFTVQRVAEVLLTPERYYTQTHKLCNCLEKLLLVTSSIRAFGGSTGGNTSQSRREEQEIQALANERGRLLSEYRRRRMQRTMQLSIDGEGHDADSKLAPSSPPKASSPEGKMGASEARGDEGVGDAEDDNDDKEDLMEAARASLRSKFDHVGIDPHSAVANANREHQNGNRNMTKSPPPPNFAGTAAGIGLAGHGGLLHHHDREHPGSPGSSLVVRTPSPILFKSTPEGASSPKKASPTPVHPTHQNLQLLQMHHAAVLAGVSPFELMGLNGGGQAASAQHGSGVGSLSIQSGGGMLPPLREMDVECRSSASSDVDSESDDVSFDDSASDRSDGSDSNEPTTSSAAARALALNRAQQQQQQLQPQRRMLGSVSSSAFSSSIGQRAPQQQQMNDTTASTSLNGGRQNEAEYQSGDSVDSMRADDSDSSSDMAD
uniref:Uncharacterized protein n=1 Tax=Amphora coffeiformis TaxID=265554 RepID=A0A7S3L3B8_9STRA